MLRFLRLPSCWLTFSAGLKLMGCGSVPKMGPGLGPRLGWKQINDVIRLVRGLNSPKTSLNVGFTITF